MPGHSATPRSLSAPGPSTGHGSPSVRAAAKLIRSYYWATPLFLLLDFGYGIDLRIPFLETMPAARFAYYGLGLACAVLVTARPALTHLVGYTESTCNIALLIITTWSAYFSVIDSVASDGVVANPFTPERVTSLIFSASIFTASHLVQTHIAVRSRALRG